jgi:hypothetical protein
MPDWTGPEKNAPRQARHGGYPDAPGIFPQVKLAAVVLSGVNNSTRDFPDSLARLRRRAI